MADRCNQSLVITRLITNFCFAVDNVVNEEEEEEEEEEKNSDTSPRIHPAQDTKLKSSLQDGNPNAFYGEIKLRNCEERQVSGIIHL